MEQSNRALTRAAYYGALGVISLLLVVWLVETDRGATQAILVEMIAIIVASGAAGWRTLQAEPRTGFGLDVLIAWVAMLVALGASVWVYNGLGGALVTERLLCTWVWVTQWASLWRFLGRPHVPVGLPLR